MGFWSQADLSSNLDPATHGHGTLSQSIGPELICSVSNFDMAILLPGTRGHGGDERSRM